MDFNQEEVGTKSPGAWPIPTLLEDAVVEASEADEWWDAVREWEVADLDEDSTQQTSCICGHDHLRYLYTIRNTLNNSLLFPIGSVCIELFDRPDMDDDVLVRMQALKLMHAAADSRCGHVDIKSGYFTHRLIRYMSVEGVFLPNDYNCQDGENDARFLDKMLNKRGQLSDREWRKSFAVIHGSVYPWLRRLWRRTQGGEPSF